MSRYRTRVCAEPGCPQLSLDGDPRCDAHRRALERDRSRRRRAEGTDYGSDHRWRSLAARIRRERGSCAECGATEQLDVHHLDGLGLLGPRAYDATNLVLLCHGCHSRVTRAQQTGQQPATSRIGQPKPHDATPLVPPRRRSGIRSVGLG